VTVSVRVSVCRLGAPSRESSGVSAHVVREAHACVVSVSSIGLSSGDGVWIDLFDRQAGASKDYD
jgi:hypothetical protein